MTVFQKMFGISERDVRKNCIICPANDSPLFINEGDKSKGLFFSAVSAGDTTVIIIKNNFLAGDCVLSLKETSCENIFLFGSCASTGQHSIGSIHLAEKSFSLESFSEMLEKSGASESYSPDKVLFDKFIGYSKGGNISPSYFAAVGSILLEKNYLEWFAQNSIGCVDMESSMIYSAAAHIKRKALALAYVTDIIEKKPFYDPLSKEESAKVASGRKALSGLLSDFIKNELA